jgi:hypothetical protein
MKMILFGKHGKMLYQSADPELPFCALCKGAGWYVDPTVTAKSWNEHMALRVMNERICGCDAGKKLESARRMSE